MIFPGHQVFKWLSYFHENKLGINSEEMCEFFHNREFSFTLEGDIYCRYECFKNEKEFVSRLIEKKPIKIDIGAVYNVPPKQHSTISSKAFAP